MPLVNFGAAEIQLPGEQADLLRRPICTFLVLQLQDAHLRRRQTVLLVVVAGLARGGYPGDGTVSFHADRSNVYRVRGDG